ncbi:MAG: hypothetical protein FJ191_06490 [Gammaproteobacteria bacterium]|nr:hypothetical protein [Gammaproteobacteria bacterium]
MDSRMKTRICCWRGVSSDMGNLYGKSGHCDYIQFPSSGNPSRCFRHYVNIAGDYLCPCGRFRFLPTLMENNLMTKILKVGVAAAVIALGAGCTDLKPLQAEVDSLKSQVSRLSGDLASVKSTADDASRAAASAQQAATSAQNTANQALSAAQAAQQCCNENRERMDRMFEKSMSK